MKNQVLDMSTAKYGTYKIWLDKSTNQWMSTEEVCSAANICDDAIKKLTPFYTKSSLPFFGAYGGVDSGYAIALSENQFTVIYAGDRPHKRYYS